MMIAAKYFRQKALLCRQIAQSLINQDEPAVAQLLALADEFDANARALESRLAQEASQASGLDELLSRQ